MVASGVRFEIHAQLRVPWGVARGTRRAPFATSSATRLTCAGALAFAAPPPKKEAMLLCPLIAARKAVRVPREQALQKEGVVQTNATIGISRRIRDKFCPAWTLGVLHNVLE